ncbi:MAG: GAF domain-containing protein [Chlorogloeopsis fritschii C42_A2020_084]|uniref:GAF domain-containing protein n=1 Tax=Chlorogloeopsis fritschii TaxID=1124 RepID=UPI001A1014EF|nr:GAF domain-containing protein [Chlorogloeopsis fritschii]MBF2007729.1 GAF domain-containing protein [Chlorogloeopsis fritschii C42_A2020_084]
MTSVYKESKENFHHTAEGEHCEKTDDSMNIIEQQLKNWRQQLQDIIKEMRQAPELDTLLKFIVRDVREKLACDRVLIYRFTSAEMGTVLAESKTAGWTPAIGENIPAIAFGLGSNKDYLETTTINNTAEVDIAPYQLQLLDKFQVKTSLSQPIFVEDKIWGLLVAHNCLAQRQWQEVEITLLSQIATELTYRLQSFEFQSKLQQQQQQQKSLIKVIDKIRQVSDVDTVFKTTTQEVRQLLQCDRVAVYRFNPDWSGAFIAESVASGWMPLVGPNIKTVWEDTHLQETQGGRYRYHESFVVNDIYQIGHTSCHLEVLEQFQVKAYVIVPVFSGSKLWGLLAAYQNSSPRNWQDWEVNLLTQIGLQFGIALSQAEYLEQVRWKSEQLTQIAEQEKALNKVVNRIRQSLDLDHIFRTTTQEVRQLIQCDRVAIYRFNPDWSGAFIAESVTSGWVQLVGPDIKTIWEDTHLQETQGGRYAKGESFVVNDIYQVGHASCHIEVLEQFQVKAYAIVPVFSGSKLWGLLAAYQNSSLRNWQAWEVNLLTQIGVQFGLAISHVESFQNTQQQSQKLASIAERQQNLIFLTRKIGEALAVKNESSETLNILQTVASEVRRLLKVDRVIVYRFNPDWSGEFVAESVDKSWVPLKEKQIDIALLQENGHCNALRNLSQTYQPREIYLQNTKAGYSRQKTTFVVDDIYKANFPPCYMELLEQFETKAYLTEPIFKDHQLWGLLAAYQNSEPRHWDEFEVNVMTQIGVLLEVAIQQADTLAQLQVQSQEQQLSIERVQLMSKIFERIRESSDLDTIFRSTVREVRSLINAERVAVFRFLPESGYNDGVFVAEDVLPGHSSVLKAQIHDHCFGEQYAAGYREGRIQAVADIHNANFTQCHIDILSQFHIRANLIVPLIKGDELWGLLCIHHCSAPRQWQDDEITLVKQIAEQFSIALQKGEYLQQMQTQSAKLAEAATREKAAKELLQKGAVQLLAAVRPALNGDLTVRAPLTEDELGTIADAYNNTLQALRQIVIQVQTAAQQVASTSRRSNASLGELTNLTQLQVSEINEALDEIQHMADSTKAVVSSAELVQLAVQQANQTVVSGDTAMNSTVEAIETIRETVAQTSKKIKRLSESSQKISKVVSLISNFATQTNVLALNAAIEATRAGEYGKGFAVVADEVRSLSRQSAAATIEIEKLVQEIQAETGEVAMAMETGIKQVVEGTNLVNETRQNLNAIVAATAEITKLLQQITEATQTQTLQSTSVTTSMKDVADIAHKTATEVNEIGAVFQHLSNMAQDLLANASKFKVE